MHCCDSLSPLVFRCTGHRLVPSCSGQLVDISYLQLVSPQLLDEGVIPLSMEEIQRYNQQQVFAAIPAHQRIQCPYPTCQALLFNADAPDFASQPAEGDPSLSHARCGAAIVNACCAGLAARHGQAVIGAPG